MPSTIQDLSSRIDELPELLPFPAVALKLMEASRCPETGVRDLCKIIECDPGLSLKLLQIANSSMYGCGGQIRTVEHASVLLGAKGLRDIAISAATGELFSSAKDPAIDALWLHSLGCAVVAGMIASNTQTVSQEEAFVAGLVHDVGKLVMVELLQEEYDLIPKALSGNCIVADEKEYFCLSHSEIGEQCGQDWGLPCEIADVMANHHSPGDAEFSEELVAVVAAANQISKVWKIGTDCEVIEIDAACVLEDHNLKFDATTLAELQENAPAEFEKSSRAFGAK